MKFVFSLILTLLLHFSGSAQEQIEKHENLRASVLQGIVDDFLGDSLVNRYKQESHSQLKTVGELANSTSKLTTNDEDRLKLLFY